MSSTRRPLWTGSRRPVQAARRPLAWTAWVAACLALPTAPAGAQTNGNGTGPASANGDGPAAAVVPDSASSLEARCETGIITGIDVESRSIFEPSSTSIAPLAWTYGALNLLHINTAESFIRDELLFDVGDCLDPFLLTESYRLLDRHGFMYAEEVSERSDGNGGYRVLVATRDEWSTKVDIGPTYDDGKLNLERLQVTEENFLGRGVFGEYTYYARRETKTQSFGVRTPRFFGRSDAGIAAGSARPGNFFEQYWRYPFVGDAGKFGMRQGYDDGTDYFAYSTDGAEPYYQALLPVHRAFAELSSAWRFGRPGSAFIIGGSFTRDVVSFEEAVVTYGDFDVIDTLPGEPPPELTRQLQPYTATRASLHLGMRRYRYEPYTGLDDLSHTELISLGVFAGLTIGRTLPILGSHRAPSIDDYYGRGHVSMTLPVGQGLFLFGSTLEGRRQDGSWQDVLLDADMVTYGRANWLPWQTLFFRASAASGWNTSHPFQLSLGGREGVRSLDEDRYPGGRMVRFVLEDRFVFPWPPETADLGMTLFSDLGRIWEGDAPYGVNSDWQAAVGFGLRVGLPKNTRHIWRLDLAFPVTGPDRSPIFRITAELNKLRSGFFTPDVRRSRQFTIGPDSF